MVSVAATLLSELLIKGHGGHGVLGMADVCSGMPPDGALCRDVVLCHRINGFRPESITLAVGYAPSSISSSHTVRGHGMVGVARDTHTHVHLNTGEAACGTDGPQSLSSPLSTTCAAAMHGTVHDDEYDGGGGGGGGGTVHSGPLLALYCCSRDRLPRPVLGALLDDMRALIKVCACVRACMYHLYH